MISFDAGGVRSDLRAAAVIVRELDEELGQPLEVLRFLRVIENFFELAGGRYHEVGLHFLALLPPGGAVLASDGPHRRSQAGVKLQFMWFELDRLGEIEIKPPVVAIGPADNGLDCAHFSCRAA